MYKKILINFPTNIGDTILGLPVVDCVRVHFPHGKITAIASPKTKNFLLHNEAIDEVVVFDKSWKARFKRRFSFHLRGKYDVAVDLKNSMIPFIVGARWRTPLRRKFADTMHVKDRYLELIKTLVPETNTGCRRSVFSISTEEKEKWAKMNFKPSIFVACSSRSTIKRYPYELLKKLINLLCRDYSVVILGEDRDRAFYGDILSLDGVTNLVGKTTFMDIFYLFAHYAQLVLCVDSSVLHVASYLNKPIVALFGPTDPNRYGPWSDNYILLRNEALECLGCHKARCEPGHRECMKIDPARVKEAVESVLQRVG